MQPCSKNTETLWSNSENPQFYEDLACLKENQRKYDTLKDVEPHRKVGVYPDGSYFISKGYNTPLWRPVQSTDRTINDQLGYKTTVVALIASLKKRYSESDACLRRIVAVVEKCREDLGMPAGDHVENDFSENSVKLPVPTVTARQEILEARVAEISSVILENTVCYLGNFENTLEMARDRIKTLAKTYKYEGDTDSALLIKEEKKAVGSLYEYCRENRLKFKTLLHGSSASKNVSDTEEVRTPPESETKKVNSLSPRTPKAIGPVELMELFEKKINDLLILDPGLLNQKTVKSNFESLFQAKCTSEDIQDIKNARTDGPCKWSKDSRIEEERAYWYDLLRVDYRTDLPADVKKMFQEGFSAALNEASLKVFTRVQKQVLKTSEQGPNMLQEIMKKIAEREERVAAEGSELIDP